MAKGRTISITIPIVVLEWYDKRAKDDGVSRSKLICGDLYSTFHKAKIEKDFPREKDLYPGI